VDAFHIFPRLLAQVACLGLLLFKVVFQARNLELSAARVSHPNDCWHPANFIWSRLKNLSWRDFNLSFCKAMKFKLRGPEPNRLVGQQAWSP
jgi:hypothetical protein